MQINSASVGETLTLEIEGRIDTTTAPALEGALKRSVTGGVKNLVFDFAKVEYISSAGLRVLPAAQRVMKKQDSMVVRNVNDVMIEKGDRRFPDIYRVLNRDLVRLLRLDQPGGGCGCGRTSQGKAVLQARSAAGKIHRPGGLCPMNKLEANVSLFIITFFTAIQYAFLQGVPDTLSHFAFLCVTNLIGFLLTLAVFFSELFRVDIRQIRQRLLLSLELFGFNVFLLLGSSVGATVSAFVLSACS